MFAKHIIGFISLYFFVIITDSKTQTFNPIYTFGVIIIIYIYFLLMAKVESKYFILIILILTILVFLQIYKEFLINKNNDNNKLNKYELYIKNSIPRIQTILLIISFLLTIIGSLIYLGMKKVEYGKEFRLGYFFQENQYVVLMI